jgi:hypothetical protein
MLTPGAERDNKMRRPKDWAVPAFVSNRRQSTINHSRTPNANRPEFKAAARQND